MEALKQTVQRYASRHANQDGLAQTPLPGLHMLCIEAPRDNLHSVYRPLLCLVLQGGKHIASGREAGLVTAGQSVIVSADLPVVGRVVRASRQEPYLAVAVELDLPLLRELAGQMPVSGDASSAGRGMGASDAARICIALSDVEALDCVARLLRLLERPEAAPLLRPPILRELHYWLLAGPQGAALRELADPDSQAGRLAAAIALLRAEYRSKLPVERLAAAAAMSLTAFHKHFKRHSSLTPGQYQKRLRLIEARRLLLEEGASATRAAYEVGYESVSQFTRDYARLFQLPPRRDARLARQPRAEQDPAPPRAAM